MARAGKGGGRDGSGGGDAALWTHVTRTVAPLRRRRSLQPATPAAAPAPQKPARPARPRPATRAPAPSAPAPALAPGAAAGLDRRTATRLRRGQLAVEGRLDLHGMTRDQAADALQRFLAASRAAGRRCVLVITGKGRRGETGGVIRAELPHWLNRPALRPMVVAFAQARPRDGGAGAFYVYLRRTRAT